MGNLLKDAAVGKRAAMEQIYRETKGTLQTTGLLLMGKNGERMLSRALGRMWDKLKKGERPEELRKFAAQCAAEVCAESLSKNDRALFHTPDESDGAERGDAFMEYFGKPEEGLRILTETMDRLPLPQRVTLGLRYAGVEKVTAARLLGIGEEVYDALCSAGERKLDRLLEGKRGSGDTAAPMLKQISALVHRAMEEISPSPTAEKAAMEEIEKNSTAPSGKKKIWIPIAAAAVLCAVLLCLILPGRGGSAENGWYADIEVEDYGTITVFLDEKTAPITVENFVSLAQDGFYDGLTFHRIMSGFMIQGGDPKGNGTGGSGKNIKGEFSQNGVKNNLKHSRGVISMARANGDMDSASSQFFIVHEDSFFLDGQYAAFGYVTSGMEVVDAIAADAKPVDNNGTILPEEQPIIEAVRVYEGGNP